MKKQIELGYRAEKQTHTMSGLLQDLTYNLTPSNRQVKYQAKSLASDVPFASYSCGCGYSFTLSGEAGRTDIKIRLHKKICEIARSTREIRTDDKTLIRNKSVGAKDMSQAGVMNLAVLRHGGMALDFEASKIAGVPQESLESLVRKEMEARK